MKRIKENSKGITIVALVITIIILLILAGISITLLFGNNGIIVKAKETTKLHKIQEIAEKLEIEKGSVLVDNKGITKIEDYLEHIVKKGIIENKDIMDTEDDYAKRIIVEEKYVFLVEEEEDGNIKITYEGEAGNIAPKLEIEVISITTNTIRIKANATRMKNGEYEYYIKDIETGEEYRLRKKQKENEYTFEGLVQNKEYQIKVVAKNSSGQAIKESGIIRTIELENLQTANITFTYNPNGWTNENVEVTANVSQTLQEGSRIQTSKDGIKWSDDFSQTFEENGEIYVRIYDGINESNYAVGEVTKIDKTKPEITRLTPSTTSIVITATDEASGIIGYTVTTSTSIPALTSFTTVTNTKSLSITKTGLSQATTYYVWVKDEAGNISSYEEATTTKQLVTKVTLNKTSTTITKGNTETLKATVSPSNAYYKGITWKSSNTSVATVSSGKITAIASGSTTITATAADGSGKTATCSVKVEEPPTLKSVAKPGDYVEYNVPSKNFTMTTAQTGYGSNQSYSTSNYTDKWQVIYNNTSYGLQIISKEIIGRLHLKGKTGYNNIVGTLNNFCSNYVNTTYATSGRSVGSNPAKPAGTTTVYTNSSYPFIAKYANDLIKSDEDYKIDIDAMKVVTNEDSTVMVNTTDKYYIATRYMEIGYSELNKKDEISVFFSYTGGSTKYYYGGSYKMYSVWSDGTNKTIDAMNYGVRPVITLKQNLIINGGDGTKENPYILKVP